MKFNKIKPKVRSIYYQIPGWHTKKRFIVIESDDWGAERMIDKKTRNFLSKKLGSFSNPYNNLDCLESNDDIIHLKEILKEVTQDTFKPKITLNCILANPDFERIRQNNFEEYAYVTYKQKVLESKLSRNVITLIKEGQNVGYFQPQFHGREHLQVPNWLELLRNNESDFRIAFDRGVYCIDSNSLGPNRKNLMAAYFDPYFNNQEFIGQSIIKGLDLFKDSFGLNSSSIIAPAAHWNDHQEKVLNSNGVRILQGFLFQNLPQKKIVKKIYHFLGERNSHNQVYITRNCYFEPSTNDKIDWVGKCLSQIKIAFRFYKPAIISTHRINFVGGIEEKNRIENLKKFRCLLNQIYKKWPDVIFLSSDELGHLILEN